MTPYWTWWQGALGLAGVALGYALFLGFSLGVSGKIFRVLNWKSPPEKSPDAVKPPPPLPAGAHLAFLLAVPLGGFLARRAGTPATSPVDYFSGSPLTGPLLTGLLLGGGVLVGLGVGLAGGCTSGHGLDGCSRLQKGSLLAISITMASAVAVAFLLKAVRS